MRGRWRRRKRRRRGRGNHKSAIAENVASSNRVIGWDEAKIINQEPDKTSRWLKESIWIRNRGNKTMSRDEGGDEGHILHKYIRP